MSHETELGSRYGAVMMEPATSTCWRELLSTLGDTRIPPWWRPWPGS